ncbi:hypothetical protein [Pimelobacter simplex]|nr:hypothetical protein [Pimelobacter simplex]
MGRPVGSWRESGERIRSVARAIQEGQLPPRTVGAEDAAAADPVPE